jgi:hypothetical protein
MPPNVAHMGRTCAEFANVLRTFLVANASVTLRISAFMVTLSKDVVPTIQQRHYVTTEEIVFVESANVTQGKTKTRYFLAQ